MTVQRPPAPTNEAAERLRAWIAENIVVFSDETNPLLDAAFATERRNTVERIKEWFDRYSASRGTATVFTHALSDDSLEGILAALLDETEATDGR